MRKEFGIQTISDDLMMKMKENKLGEVHHKKIRSTHNYELT